MSAEPKERGWGILLLIGLVAMPVTAVVVWALMLVLNIVFEVPISLDWAFGIIILSGLLGGPAVVTWLVARQRTRTDLGKGST